MSGNSNLFGGIQGFEQILHEFTQVMLHGNTPKSPV